jgi:guanylate kinase
MSHRKTQTAPNGITGTRSGRTGRLFILSAPSGAGKSTLCKAALDQFPDMLYSISYTTRPPRPGESHGVDYFFIDKGEFEAGIEQGRWAEWAEVYGNYYGTSRETLSRTLNDGRDILLDIDVQGMRQIQSTFPDGITIFIMPPSLDTLRRRLTSRGTENSEVMAIRLQNAQKEMAQKDRYRHVIVNEVLADATDELISLMAAYRS